MALATSCYVRDTALKYAQQGIDITKAALGNWSRSAPAIYSGGVSKRTSGWSMQIGEEKEDEDLTWLL